MITKSPRRGFLGTLAGGVGFGALASPSGRAQTSSSSNSSADLLPSYVRKQNYKSLKQSTYDRSGGNRDARPIPGGQTLTVFDSSQPGVITHIWFTIAARGGDHLKELILRAYWDGNAKPSVEVPIGDFFGLNLGQYFIYESAFLACSPGKSLNCYFAMPFRKSARITVTNEGTEEVSSFYSNIDYQEHANLPDDVLYFHTQYRQAAPCIVATDKVNPDGQKNYVFTETHGSGHLMGVTLGVQINAERWMGEGDDMIFIDDETKPAIIGTGSEDYILGSWNFGGRDGAQSFAHHYYGAPLIVMPERTGGRYCMYRWHGDNPVSFNRYLKHTMEHGHANDRGDNWYSACYWYQREVFTDFPALPPAKERIPRVHNNP